MFHKQIPYYLFFFFIFFFGQTQGGQYKFDHITIKDGLTENTVNCIFQDSRGYMWFGTFDGLNRFDGYQIKQYKYNPQDSNTLSNNTIRDIQEDHLGYLWIGTDNGLNRMNLKTGKNKLYLQDSINSNSIASNRISELLLDDNLNFWIAHSGRDISHYNRSSNKFSHYQLPDDFSASCLSKIKKQDGQNHILAGGTGLWEINPVKKTIKPFLPLNHPVQKNTIRCLQVHNDHLWAGTWENGLYKINLKTKKYTHIKPSGQEDSLPHHTITSIEPDDHNRLWIGTRGGGVSLLDLKTMNFQNFKKEAWREISIGGIAIKDIYKSQSGIMWFGTFSGGVSRLSLQSGINKFAHFFPGKVVKDVAILEKEHLLVGTRFEGLYQARFSEFNKLETKKIYFPQTTINCINPVQNNENWSWIGTEGKGMYKLNHQTQQYIPFLQDQLKRHSIMDVKTTPNQELWIATWNKGLFNANIDGKINAVFSEKQKDPQQRLTNNSITVISIENDSLLWIGTKGDGAYRINYKEKRIKDHYYHLPEDSNSLSHNDVFNILTDSDGAIWLGTTGKGINKFDPVNNQFKHYTKKDGLPSNMIYAMEEDQNHHLWISTTKGLAKFNKTVGKFITYTTDDGIQANQFSSNASSREGNHLFFGGINGFNHFNPDSIRMNINRYLPPIVITKIKANNKAIENISNGQTIHFDFNHNDFSVHFSALDYTQPEKNQYKYILIGYDKKWTKTTSNHRIARYTNLKPDEYLFKVIGSNNDDLWNEEGTSIRIKIHPPFWQTTWFILIIAGALSIILFLWLRYMLQRMNKKRELIIQEKTKETLFNKENQLRTLVDHLPDFIYIKDRESKFILANNKLANVMIGENHSPEELIGKKDHDFYEKNLADQYFRDEQEIMEKGTPLIGNIEPGKDEQGNPIIVSTTKVPVKNNHGQIIGIVGIGRDITRLKKAEEKIKQQAAELQETNTLLEERQEEILQQKEEIEAQRDELSTLNSTKDKFFSIIGHDLKNPFHAIMSLTDILKNTSGERSAEEIDEMIDMIKTSSENAYELLENLLQWSRSQTGRINYNPQEIDIQDIGIETVNLLNVSAEKKNIKLISQINSQMMAFADKNMVQTIIRNLINNAIKFTPEEGVITLKGESTADYIKIHIQDTGIGMDPEFIEGLFAIDRQKSTKGTSGESGTGLGLIICKEFAEQNGGNIYVKSTPGEGSIFTLQLPKAKTR